VRGRIMKELVKRWTVHGKRVEEEFPHKNVKNIVEWMAKEKLIVMQKWVVLIAE
jgi:hypothetical protein